MKYILSFLLFIIIFNINAQEAFYIKNFDVNILVNNDGSFDVTEKIHVFFNESRRGIIRQIPYKYDIEEVNDSLIAERTENSDTYEILFENIKVDTFEYKTYTEGYFQYIRIGSENKYLKDDVEYTIKYKVWGALNRFENHDEFYWNITGNGWDCKIQKATFKINFEKETNLTDENIRIYTGTSGEKKSNAAINFDSKSISGYLTKSLEAYQGITIAVKLPKNYFKNIETPIEKYAANYYIKNHNANYNINKDASIDVDEVFDIKLVGKLYSFERNFPDDYELNGEQRHILVKNIEAFALNNNNDTIILSDIKPDKLHFGSFQIFTKTYGGFKTDFKIRLKYKLLGVLNFTNDYVNISWPIIPKEIIEPVENSSFEIEIEKGIKFNDKSVSFYNNMSPTDSIEYQINNNKIEGKLVHRQVNNTGFNFYIELDRNSINKKALPLYVYAGNYIIEDFFSNITIEKNGVINVSNRVIIRYITHYNNYFYAYIKNKYNNKISDKLPKLNFPKRRLFSTNYYPLIYDVKSSDSLTEFTHNKNYNILKWYNKGYKNECTYTYEYKIYDLLVSEDEKYNLKIPLFYDFEETVIHASYTINFADNKNHENVIHKSYLYYNHKNGENQNIYNKYGAFTGEFEAINAGTTPIAEISFPKNLLKESNTKQDIKLIINNNKLIYRLLLILIVLYIIWFIFGRDKKDSITVQYYPPEDLTAAEAGYIWDNKLHKRDLIALIYEWAGKKYLKIENTVNEKYKLIKLQELPKTAKNFEKTIFNKFFYRRTEVEISTLRNSFYYVLEEATKQLLNHSLLSSLYKPGTRIFSKILYIFSIIIFSIAAILLIISLFSLDFQAPISFTIFGLIIMYFSKIMPKYGHFGSKKHKELLGFKEFIEKSELPRIEELLKENPEYFNQTIAYAIVMGMGNLWANKFQPLLKEPPSFYNTNSKTQYSTIGIVNDFITSMHKMETDLNYKKPVSYSSSSYSSSSSSSSSYRSSSSSYSSSSGSGSSSFSSSGGSSGGGYGGGGGSSW